MSKIFNLLQDLSSSKRWNNAYCTSTESVLEHTGFVVMYSYHLARKHDLSVLVTLSKALLHDVEEAKIGDIITPTKHDNHKIESQIYEVSKKAAKEICLDLFCGESYLLWEQSKDLRSSSGCIVAIADIAASVYKIRMEVNRGNVSFLEFTENTLNGLESLKTKVMKVLQCEVQDLIDTLMEIQ